MKKRAVFFPAIMGIVLLLGTCANILSPQKDRGAIPPGKGRLAILSGGERTALPSATFDSYVLRFVYGGAEGYTHEAVEWSDGVSVDLEPGAWTVCLDAYVGTAVSGTGSAAVTVSAGTVTPVTITIGVHGGAGIPGTLKYRASYPPADADHAYGTQTLTVRDAAGTLVEGPVHITNGAEGSLALSPGVYFVGVVIENTIQRTGAARISAVHIYGGQETSLEFTLAEDEFIALVPLTVTVDLTVPGDVTVSSRKVRVFSGEACEETQLLAETPDMTGNAVVALWIPSSYANVCARQEIVVAGNTYKDIPKRITVIPDGATAIAMAYRTTRHVRTGRTGDGTSWENASNDAQKMMDELAVLAAANPGYPGSYIVKLGAGTYKPEWEPMIPAANAPYTRAVPADPRDAAFILRQGVQVWGGYPEAGGDSRNVDSNVTVLSGDFNGDDAPVTDDDGHLTTINNAAENACHVVVALGLPDGSGTALDGLAITGGNANRSASLSVGAFLGNTFSLLGHSGGGIYNNNSSLLLTNATISGNSAAYGGGGIYNEYSSPVLTNATISGNLASGDNGAGGGMYNNKFSSPVMNGGEISGNRANTGGGIHNNNHSSPKLYSVTISGNEAGGAGGGMHNSISSSPVMDGGKLSNNSGAMGGGMYNWQESSPVLTNMAISGNSGGSGGGIYNDGGSPTLTNVTISGNSVTDGSGGGINNFGDSLVLREVIISGNSATGSGGGIYNRSSPKLTSVTISSNSATYGGGINNSGGSPVLTDVTISDNSATEGGGMNNESSSPVMKGGEISDNTATYGGGIYNYLSSPALTGVTISGNSATEAGGMYNNISSPVMNGGEISDNTADGEGASDSYGGGIYNYGGSPELTGVVISDNRVINGSDNASGGGMYSVDSKPALTNVTISGNTADNGGGMFNERTTLALINATISGNTANEAGGGIFANDEGSRLVLINVIISGNIASNGGGMRNDYRSSLVLINVTIAGNYASARGGGINNNDNPTLTVRNSIIWGNTASAGADVDTASGTSTFAYSIVQGSGGSDSWNTTLGTDGGNNLNGDPLFIASDPAAAGSPKTGGDYRLMSNDSPAIDAGSNGGYPSSTWSDWNTWITDLIGSNPVSETVFESAIAPALSKDLAGTTRIQGGAIDMGAYEKE